MKIFDFHFSCAANNYQVGSTYYNTLAEAFNNAANGSTIKVLQDVAESTAATVASGKTFILDLNGKTIIIDLIVASGYLITNNGTLTLKDSAGNGEIKSLHHMLLTNYGEANIESGTYTIENKYDLDYSPTAIVNTGGILNIKGGTINFTNELEIGGYSIIGVKTQSGGTVNQTGGIINVKDLTSKDVRGIFSHNGKSNINISGGEINVYSAKFSAYAVIIDDINSNEGTIVISGSPTITATAYYPRTVSNFSSSKDLVIKGGTIIAKNLIESGTITSIAVDNTASKTIIGDSSNSVTKTTPVFQSDAYAVYCYYSDSVSVEQDVEFYDGILKDKKEVFKSANVIPTEGYGIHYDTEVINSETYKTAYLIPKIMVRETQKISESVYDNLYMIGAERAGLTQYTSAQVKTITILNSSEVPKNATASWDISIYEDIKGVMAWIIPAGTQEGMQMYDLYIGGNGGIMVPSGQRLFAHYINCTEINNVNLLNTSETTDMHAMFYRCESIKTLDVSNWNTSKVTGMQEIFSGCNALETIDVSNWDTSNVTYMNHMFWECKTLNELDVSNFKTSNVTTIRGIFAFCENVTELNVSNWDTKNVTDMCYVFQDCVKLGNVDVSKWNTSKVTAGFEYMFYNCDAMTGIKVTNFDTSKAESMYGTFAECDNLEGINLNTWNTASVTTMQEMFKNSTALKSILLGPNFAVLNGNSMFKGAN